MLEQIFSSADSVKTIKEGFEVCRIPPSPFSSGVSSSHPVKTAFYMLVFCERGTLRVKADLVEHTLSRSDVLFMLPGTMIEEVSRGSGTRFFCVAYSAEMRRKYFNSTSPEIRLIVGRIPNVYHQAMDEDEFAANWSLFDALTSAWDTLKDNVRDLYFSGIVVSWTSLVASWLQKHLIMEGDVKSRDREVYLQFLSDIQKHCPQQKEVAFYAKEACLSTKYFSKRIFHISGKHPSEIIRDQVILTAKRLLTSSETTIQQVSEMLNFPNPSFFSRYFKAATGMTPFAYKRGRSSSR